MPRYKLRTLLIVLALGPIGLWLCVGLFDAYRWLATYPDPEPFYITGPDPLRWIGVTSICVICVIPASLAYALFRRRNY